MSQPWRPRLTVAAVIERDGSYLLIEEETKLGLKLNTPAGHLEPGETPAQGCAREVLEEAAFDFTPTAFLGIYIARSRKNSTGEDQTYVRLAFTGDLGAHHAGRPLDQGIVRTLWMTLEEVRASADRHRSPLVLKCIEDHALGVRYPLEAVFTDGSVLALRS
jgi:8-oxo-dGTP pyrophosphatase MutT (NUDIX family)